MYLSRDKIRQALKENFTDKLKSVHFNIPTAATALNAHIETEPTSSLITNTVINENGIKFHVDWDKGQKTGFFLDQRDNRRLLGSLSTAKTVLNCFCYTGGFSMYALKNDAAHVTSIDISEWATHQVKLNEQLNKLSTSKHEIITGNVMDYLNPKNESKFDIVVIDPPAFAKNQKKRHNAVQAYKRLNKMAMSKVKKGGLLFTFSCSQVVSSELFTHTVRAAAIEAKRNIRISLQLTQGHDHPINIFHPEGSYLKGLVLYID